MACTIINHFESERGRERNLMGMCQAPKWTAHLCSPNGQILRCAGALQGHKRVINQAYHQKQRLFGSIYTYGPRSSVRQRPCKISESHWCTEPNQRRRGSSGQSVHFSKRKGLRQQRWCEVLGETVAKYNRNVGCKQKLCGWQAECVFTKWIELG